jgi:hypothetical protein
MNTTRTFVALLVTVAVSSGAHAASTDVSVPPSLRCEPTAPSTWGYLGSLVTWSSLPSLGSEVSAAPAFDALAMPQTTATKSSHAGATMLALIGSGLVSIGILVRRRLFNADNDNEPA